jgi:hypothetical protein
LRQQRTKRFNPARPELPNEGMIDRLERCPAVATLRRVVLGNYNL